MNYWAAQASTVLLVAVGLAAIFIQCDINFAAKLDGERAVPLEPMNRAAVPDTRVREETEGADDLAAAKWKEANKLTFDSATVVTAVIGTIAPFLASPAVDLVTKVLH